MIAPDRIAPELTATELNPESTRNFLGRLNQDFPSAYQRILATPAALRCAVSLFSYSRFLSEFVLRDPERLLHVAASRSFNSVLTLENYRERLYSFLGAGVPSAVDFARFRRRQLLRILLRDVLGAATLANVTEELSNLADAILDVAYRRIRAELVARHGEPRLEDGALCGFSVVSLGKLGGKELNYSSDIDLMFVYGGNGETDGPAVLTNKEFYKKVANQYTAMLSSYTAEGQCYRVDLRLRPDGTLGEIAVSEDGARAYYSERARDWEKQMLIKARISAGESEPGAGLLEFVEPLIYQSSLDFRAVEAVSETRQRISEKLAAKRGVHGGLDVKLTPGGIRDIEFLVQCLQRLHGGREQWVRHGGTVFALFRLRDKGFLSDGEYARLSAAYTFLRYLEHRLQMEEDRQTHTLPNDPDRLDLLARKMPIGATGAILDGEGLKQHLQEHLSAVREIYHRVVHAYRQPPNAHFEPRVAPLEEADASKVDRNLERVLGERAPRLAAALAAANLRRGRARFEHFLEEAVVTPELLARLEASPAGVLDIFENSAHFGDQILRYPELLEEICEPFQLEGGPLQDGAALRRFYRRQMLRIQCESMLGRAPIFETLGKTSVLADSVIAAAYRIALTEAPPPSGAGYLASDQMMVISLGRLGMREFDLGSDADVNFVIPDDDAAELVYWTGVAERIIQTLSSYTGEGVMFAIDTRLKPDGRAGDLVQTEAAYKAYFAGKAEAWEGIAYMKARAIAGNLERATVFLHELQDVDWRRYGQSMRSRHELGEMRARLEREQGARNPLKAGVGGYFDIDFALMYLRLRGAGIFYKVLNTPERIEVIEKMGHLTPEDASFLRDASTFYRALDHGQRLSTGHAEGSLPTSRAQFDVLTNLVKRWTPAHLHEQPLDITLAEIRRRTREFFERLFGGA
jgi:[glutamine synthetase] adenylyltransferase / [glutamine synthetase]-adenylyl-L-tyrosine phosphorylase